ncbi:MAG TPA: dihydrolipoyl dehydrogenase, partial [Stellaceae bacterium]|nr:dihydrolipoyl dehydrogenase [Stellaceae bacterium]
LGGTCLNIGCIPSKALLQSSEKYADTQHALAQHGIAVGDVTFDLKTMMARKDKVVAENTRGISFLFRKNKVDHVKGAAKLLAPNRIDVAGRVLEAKRAIVVATGSDSVPLPGVEIDEKTILSSTGALSLTTVPRRLVVVGGGYIGLELGSVWRRLGSEVTVIEFLDRITPGMDGELSTALQRTLAKQGLVFRLGTKVVEAKRGAKEITLAIEPAAGGAREEIAADAVLVSIGRRPFTEGLGLETVGVARDNRGRITVDAHYAASVPGIYAIGDVIAGPMLAHKASDEGAAVAEFIAGEQPALDYDAIPAVIYTWPEVASVGKTEEELKEAGVRYKVGKFPFSANPRARANGDTEGFVKILAETASDRVRGVHIIGPDAGTIIAEAALAMEFGASAEDIARTCHAHPTLNEALKEAALAADGRAIHM